MTTERKYDFELQLITRTSWHMNVSDGSIFWIFHAHPTCTELEFPFKAFRKLMNLLPKNASYLVCCKIFLVLGLSFSHNYRKILSQNHAVMLGTQA